MLAHTINNQRHLALASLESLRPWLGVNQHLCVRDALKGEEWQFFAEKISELLLLIEVMPKTYESDGQGKQAFAYLHYFAGGSANWYITEKDKGAPGDGPEEFQSQAFGRADLFGDGGELGYINIREIVAAGGELDFYWTPKRLEEIE